MPNKKSLTLYSFHAPLVLLLLLLGTGVLLARHIVANPDSVGQALGASIAQGKSADAKSNKTKGNSSKSTAKGKAVKQETPTPAAQKYQSTVQTVVTDLQELSDAEEEAGNTDVSDELDEIAQDQEETTEDVTGAITAVQTKSKWQKLLFGTDYKNLGQLRSSLAHNTNNIRKLEKLQGDATTPEASAEIQTQLDLLNAERDSIVGIIQEEEDQFSLLGWVVKLLTGYDNTPADDGSEVEETTESVHSDTDSTAPVTDLGL